MVRQLAPLQPEEVDDAAIGTLEAEQQGDGNGKQRELGHDQDLGQGAEGRGLSGSADSDGKRFGSALHARRLCWVIRARSRYQAADHRMTP